MPPDAPDTPSGHSKIPALATSAVIESPELLEALLSLTVKAGEREGEWELRAVFGETKPNGSPKRGSRR